MTTITNPVIAGFNPDPSIIRVGDAYYVATSTFEWFPGICLYKSYDLKTGNGSLIRLIEKVS